MNSSEQTLEAKRIRSALFSTFNKENLIEAMEQKGITEASKWLLTIQEVIKWRKFTLTFDVLWLAQAEKVLICLGYSPEEACKGAIDRYNHSYEKEY